MLSVIIKDNNEPNVIKLTYENLWREIKDMPDSEIIVGKWSDYQKAKNKLVSFVEADCLVNSGYFSSLMGLMNKDPLWRKISVMGSATAVNQWHNKFYGYSVGDKYSDGVQPSHDKKSSRPYPVQIAFIPGSIIRKTTLQKLADSMEIKPSWEKDLVYYSTMLSLGFWRLGTGGGSKHINGQVGCRVHLNPNTTYVTTEEYVNDIGKFDPKADDVISLFKSQSV